MSTLGEQRQAPLRAPPGARFARTPATRSTTAASMHPARASPATAHLDAARGAQFGQPQRKRGLRLFRHSDEPERRHATGDLRVHVEEADAAGARAAFQPRRERLEPLHMVRDVVGASQQDRAVAPHHAIGPQSVSKRAERFQQPRLAGQARLHVGTVGVERELHEIGRWADAIQFGFAREQHGRILRPERDAIHRVRRQDHTAHPSAHRRVAHEREALFEPSEQPVEMKPRDVGSSRCADDHSSSMTFADTTLLGEMRMVPTLPASGAST